MGVNYPVIIGAGGSNIVEPGQVLIIDKVSSGVKSLYEQILGTLGSANYNEAATNSLINYMIVQGYDTAVFKETNASPFVDSPTDDVYNANGKQMLEDIAARMYSAGISFGIQVDGLDLHGYKRIADYNVSAASYEKITVVYASSEWWNLSGSKTVYTTFRDTLLQAIDDGPGPAQVDWQAGGNKIFFMIDVGDSRTVWDAFSDGSIDYDQLCDLSESLAAQYGALGINPFYANTPALPWQPLAFSFRCFAPIPNYDNIRVRVWKTCSDSGLWSLMIETDPSVYSSNKTFFVSVSPETQKDNITGSYDATKYYSGYFFEGRAIPGTPPASGDPDPAIVRNKKDALAAFDYIALDINTAIATQTNTNSVMGTVGESGNHPYNMPNRYCGDHNDYNYGRIPLPSGYKYSSTPYESIQDETIASGFWCYYQEGLNVGQVPAECLALNPTYTFVSGAAADVYLYMSFGGIIITSQYIMRKYTDSLPHGPVTIDLSKYGAATSPNYTNKYYFTPSIYTDYNPVIDYAPFNTPVQVPYGQNWFPPLTSNGFSYWFSIIHDSLPLGVTTPNRIWWREFPYGATTAADFVNPNAPEPSFNFLGEMSFVSPKKMAQFAVSRSGKALTWYQGHGNGIATKLQYQTRTTGFLVELLPEPITFSIDGTNVSCNAGSDGEATVVFSSGTVTRGPFTYQWYLGDPDVGGVILTGETAITISGVPAGEYWVVVTAADLTTTKGSVTITEPLPIVVELEAFSDNCNGSNNGFITIGVSGGAAPYTFSWTGPGGFTATTQGLSGLSTEGVYTVAATDSNGCVAYESFSIYEITTPPITLAVSGLLTTCPGSFVTVSIISDYSAFNTIYWDDLNIDVGAINVSTPGTVSVVGYIRNCTSYAEVVIPPAVPLGISSSSVVNQICGQPSSLGSISITPEGGCAPYTYLWSGPLGFTSTDQNLTDLFDFGVYTVLITDAAGGTFTQDFTLGTDTFDLLFVGEIICNGGSTDLIVEPTGGVAPFTFVLVDSPPGFSVINMGGYGQVTGATVGVYDFLVTDANGCEATGTYQLTSSVTVTATATAVNATAVAANDGSATATGSGGTAPYTYLWSNGETTQSIGNLAPGDYEVVITDDTGCQGSAMVTVSADGDLQDLLDGINCREATLVARYLTFIFKGLDGTVWMKKALYLRLAKAALLRYKQQLIDGVTPCADYEAIIQRAKECGCR